MIERASALRIESGRATRSDDALTAEYALAITINGTPFTVTMRTPGHDRLLARGLLHTEGVISNVDAAIEWTEELYPETQIPRSLDARVEPEEIANLFATRRSLLSTSSCGLCGRADLADGELAGPPVRSLAQPFAASRIDGVFAAMRREQSTFAASGGSHAACVFNGAGVVRATFEDIGRHNAADKCVGWLVAHRAFDRVCGLAVSGRLSYEIVAKAYRARLPLVLAVSAPSSLAVKVAERLGITVAGFCRDGRATIYTHAANLDVDSPP